MQSAAGWKQAIAEYGTGTNNWRQAQFDQIVGNWGRFESGEVQPAGRKATAGFRFRNGHKVSFEARPINVAKLLDDLKAYLKNNPAQLNWSQLNISNIGYRLVNENQSQYVGDKIAAWNMNLTPRPEHMDDRVTVTTPLTKAGAYLVTATMADGNTSRIVVWLSGTIVVKKNLDGKLLYYVADAVTGRPVAKADVELFGYRQVQVQPGKPGWRVETIDLAEQTDADGLVQVKPKLDRNQPYQWLAIARKKTGGAAAALPISASPGTGMEANTILNTTPSASSP